MSAPCKGKKTKTFSRIAVYGKAKPITISFVSADFSVHQPSRLQSKCLLSWDDPEMPYEGRCVHYILYEANSTRECAFILYPSVYFTKSKKGTRKIARYTVAWNSAAISEGLPSNCIPLHVETGDMQLFSPLLI
jgi:hypothetical protein